MDEWVVWFYVEPFTLHMNRDRGQFLLSPIVLVPVLVSALVLDTASVITPIDTMKSQKFSHHRRLFRHREILEFFINAARLFVLIQLVSQERHIASCDF